MEYRTCPKCGMRIPFNAKVCPYCHTDPRGLFKKGLDGFENLFKIIFYIGVGIALLSGALVALFGN